MKLVVPVQLYPGAAAEAALRDTLALCNDAATLVSAQAFDAAPTRHPGVPVTRKPGPSRPRS